MIQPAYWCDACGNEIEARHVRAADDVHWNPYVQDGKKTRRAYTPGAPYLCAKVRRILPEHVTAARAGFLNRKQAGLEAAKQAAAEGRE